MGAHGHSHGHDAPDVELRSPTAARIVVGLVAACVAATVIGLFVIWPSGTDDLVTTPALDVELVDATVTGARTAPCLGAEDLQPSGCIDVEIEVTSGPTEGDQASFQFSQGPNTVDLAPGDRIVVSYNADAPEGTQYLFADFDRGRSLTALLLLFVASVLALGAFRGLRALVGAAVSLVVLIAVILPALLEGTSPMAVALVGASTIALLALFLTHGFNHRTAVAYVGTTAALALTAVLA
ncbi:MAG: YibE/F family protein, partial [Actinomycetota bacterium]